MKRIISLLLGKRQISRCLAQEYGMRENTIESNKVPCTLE